MAELRKSLSPKSVRDWFDVLSRDEDTPLPSDALDVVRAALRGKDHLAAMRAARLIALHGWGEGWDGLVDDVAAAFERYVAKPDLDKGCLAKDSIADALNELDTDVESVFLSGARHVQMEPVFGSRVDTAGGLRGRCVYGLARMGHPETLRTLCSLLADANLEARRGGIRVARYLGGYECELLLRFKALTGDPEPELVADCFSALMEIAPAASMELVAKHLDSDDLVLVESAALALGESRTLEAFAALRERYEANVEHRYRRMLCMPIALTRRDEAFDFLLGVVRDAHPILAKAAAEAAELFEDGGPRTAQLEDAMRRLR